MKHDKLQFVVICKDKVPEQPILDSFASVQDFIDGPVFERIVAVDRYGYLADYTNCFLTRVGDRSYAENKVPSDEIQEMLIKGGVDFYRGLDRHET